MNNKIVVDASAALKWHFKDESDSENAARMLLDYEEDKVGFLVPRLFYYEIANAVHIAIQRGRISEDDGAAIIKDMLEIETRVIDSPELIRNACLNARKYSISVYDAVYLTLAKEQDCQFYTGDRKLYAAIGDKKRFIKLVVDYRSL